jgi:deoxyadenosine/deoxycytidine kinase
MQTSLALPDAPATPAERPRTYVAIAGNIGAGKSALTQVLADYFGWTPFFERVDDNPYLADFYADMRRWSFNLQVFFLSSRFRHQKEMEAEGGSVVQDRSIYEDVEIFARNLHDLGLMDGRDYENYRALFSIMVGYLRPPDLLIYLRASVPTLVRQIQARGRDFEAGIRIDYLERLNVLYEDWIARYPHPRLVVETDALDFVGEPEDRFEIVSRIESRLYGLFPERV